MHKPIFVLLVKDVCALIKEGLTRLTKMGVDLVFIVGHPEYYLRFGFSSASKLGFQPNYPLPVEVADV
jgi:putative acetyltransferase